MRKKYFISLIPILAFSSFLGCDDGEMVTIEGSMSLDLDYADTGFEFSAGTPLVSEAEEATPGCAAGGCRITVDEHWDPVSLELWLDRGTDGEQGLGFRSFDVTITEGEALVSAMVAATDGDVSYSSSGAAHCVVSDLSAVSNDGSASLSVDCDLLSNANQNAHASADLHLTGCTVDTSN